jgi:hypothetical protein
VKRHSRFQITLKLEEADALCRLAASELRNPRDQIRHILRCELQRRGLLPIQAVQDVDYKEEALLVHKR